MENVNDDKITRRATGLLVLEVVNSNPNGDPDNESDPRTRVGGWGEISPVSFKRKLRDLVEEKAGPVWLETAAADTFNKTLPSSLGVHFRHKRFQPMQLQHLSLRFINELSGNGPRTIARILRVGCRGRALGFAGLVLQARQRSARQARMLLRHLEQAMAANRENASARGQTDKVWTPACAN